MPDFSQVRRDPLSNAVTLLKGDDLSRPLRDQAGFGLLRQEGRHGEIVLMFLHHYRQFFRLRDPRAEFAVTAVDTDHLSFTHVRLAQSFAGLPVIDAELIVHLNGARQVYLVDGFYLPTPRAVTTKPGLGPDEARRIAGLALGGDPEACRQCPCDLVIFPDPERQPHMAYRLVYQPRMDEGWQLFVDALTGAVLDRRSTVQSGGGRPSFIFRGPQVPDTIEEAE